jgi:hypothetical protein
VGHEEGDTVALVGGGSRLAENLYRLYFGFLVQLAQLDLVAWLYFALDYGAG